MEMMEREVWCSYFLRIAQLVSERSTCRRRHVGALAVRDRRILATGYNGTPVGVPHCTTSGIACLREELNVPSGERHEICRGVHAEQNVIIQAASSGVSLKDADLYCTHQPCFICFKMLVNCGIRNIFYIEPYDDDMTRAMLQDTNLRMLQVAL